MFIEGGKSENKRDPFTLERFIAWLETKDQNEKYDYSCNRTCALAQYFTAMGFENVGICYNRLSYTSEYRARECIEFPMSWASVAINHDADAISFRRGWNFGDLLQRAKALQMEKVAA